MVSACCRYDLTPHSDEPQLFESRMDVRFSFHVCAGGFCLQLDRWRCSQLWPGAGRDSFSHKSRAYCIAPLHREAGGQWVSYHYRFVLANKKKWDGRWWWLVFILMSSSSGSEQFSVYSGFSDSFEWAGPHEDNLPRYACSNYAPYVSIFYLTSKIWTL